MLNVCLGTVGCNECSGGGSSSHFVMWTVSVSGKIEAQDKQKYNGGHTGRKYIVGQTPLFHSMRQTESGRPTAMIECANYHGHKHLSGHEIQVQMKRIQHGGYSEDAADDQQCRLPPRIVGMLYDHIDLVIVVYHVHCGCALVVVNDC